MKREEIYRAEAYDSEGTLAVPRGSPWDNSSTLLDGRPVLRLNAADTGFALPSLKNAWDILLIDNIQDMQEERDWQALRGQEQRGDRGDPEHPGLHGQEPCEQRAQ